MGALVFVGSVSCLLVVLSYHDSKERRLPNSLVAAVFILGCLWMAWCCVQENSTRPLVSAGLGLLLAAGPAACIEFGYRAIRKQSGIGAGDIKLLAALGVCLGTQGFWILPLASILFLLSWPLVYAAKKWRIQTKFPFGPYLACSACVLLVLQYK